MISEDPARDGGNWYSYVGNNPISMLDPTGLSTVPPMDRPSGVYPVEADPETESTGSDIPEWLKPPVEGPEEKPADWDETHPEPKTTTSTGTSGTKSNPTPPKPRPIPVPKPIVADLRAAQSSSWSYQNNVHVGVQRDSDQIVGLAVGGFGVGWWTPQKSADELELERIRRDGEIFLSIVLMARTPGGRLPPMAGGAIVVSRFEVEMLRALLAGAGIDILKMFANPMSGIGGEDPGLGRDRPFTRPEAKAAADKLDYKEIKDPPFNSHGQPVFRKGNLYISPDRDGHLGGTWKLFNGTGKRLGTYNLDLTIRMGD